MKTVDLGKPLQSFAFRISFGVELDFRSLAIDTCIDFFFVCLNSIVTRELIRKRAEHNEVQKEQRLCSISSLVL